jgi:hypothetical protein
LNLQFPAPLRTAPCSAREKIRENIMSDPLDELIRDPEIIAEEHPRSRNTKRPGGFLNLLSGLFLAGTIVVGLLFVILFINPQSSLNPLPQTTLPALILASNSSSAPKPVLPPTWTPMISPTDSPTSIPIPTATTMSEVKKFPAPIFDLESDDAFFKPDGSPTSVAEPVQEDDGCAVPGAASQIFDLDGHPLNTELAPELSQAWTASASPGPIPTDQSLTEPLTPVDAIADLFTPEIQYWEEDILAWGEEYGLDPNLIATVMQIESCGYVKAKSAAGAMGLFQVMPQHFKDKDDPYDPETNAFRGLSWLQKTLRSGGSTKMALAGYNAGIARAKNPNLEWPDETQRYVDWGILIYQDSMCGYDSSAALNNWLSKGGSLLCDHATAEQQDS